MNQSVQENMLHVVPTVHVGSGRGVFSRIPARLLFGTLAAQKGATEQQQGGGTPPDKQRRPQFTLLRLRHHRVVKVLDGGVCRPGHRDQTQNPGDQEQNTGHDANPGFGVFIVDTVGALSSGDTQQQPEQTHQDGDDDHGPSRLQVLRKRQHGVVNFALHLSGALHHTVHPQSLPEGLRGHDVLPDKRGDFPHGKRTHDDQPDPPDQSQNQTQSL